MLTTLKENHCHSDFTSPIICLHINVLTVKEAMAITNLGRSTLCRTFARIIQKDLVKYSQPNNNHVVSRNISCFGSFTSNVRVQSCDSKSIHIDQTILFTEKTPIESSNDKTTLPTHNISQNSTLSAAEYEEIVEESLHSLTDYFDEILEKSSLSDFDVMYSDGVLTVKLGANGTYVINKQTPNKQIWLSSPSSGPKRYDFIDQTWIYKHNGEGLYDLLNKEIPKIVTGISDIDFVSNCTHGKSIISKS